MSKGRFVWLIIVAAWTWVSLGFLFHHTWDYNSKVEPIALRSPPSWQPHASQYPYISNLAVRKSYRRQGVARQLLLACERTSLEWGFPDLYLHVLENNHQARQLYLKAGYQLRQVEPSYSAWLFGQPKRLFLQKHIDLSGKGWRLSMRRPLLMASVEGGYPSLPSSLHSSVTRMIKFLYCFNNSLALF